LTGQKKGFQPYWWGGGGGDGSSTGGGSWSKMCENINEHTLQFKTIVTAVNMK
jgi:hypothetical protein